MFCLTVGYSYSVEIIDIPYSNSHNILFNFQTKNQVRCPMCDRSPYWLFNTWQIIACHGFQVDNISVTLFILLKEVYNFNTSHNMRVVNNNKYNTKGTNHFPSVLNFYILHVRTNAQNLIFYGPTPLKLCCWRIKSPASLDHQWWRPIFGRTAIIVISFCTGHQFIDST